MLLVTKFVCCVLIVLIVTFLKPELILFIYSIIHLCGVNAFPCFSSCFHCLCDITLVVKIFTLIGYKVDIQNIKDLQNTT